MSNNLKKELCRIATEEPELFRKLVKEASVSKTATQANLWKAVGGAVIEGEASIPRGEIFEQDDMLDTGIDATSDLLAAAAILNDLSGYLPEYASSRAMTGALQNFSEALYRGLFAVGKIRGQEVSYRKFMKSPRRR